MTLSSQADIHGALNSLCVMHRYEAVYTRGWEEWERLATQEYEQCASSPHVLVSTSLSEGLLLMRCIGTAHAPKP
jgi:hypothetical protein